MYGCAHLADRARGGFQHVAPERLNGIDHDQIRRRVALKRGQNGRGIGLRSKSKRGFGNIKPFRSHPDLLGGFAADLFDAARRGGKRITRDALALLAATVPVNPAAVFHEREYLLDAARAGGPGGLCAAKTVAALCAHGANYRGKLSVPALRLLNSVADKDLARWIAALFLAALILCAGVVTMDSAKEREPFDPRKTHAPTRTISPLDASYRGFIPEDAVIPTPEGFFGPDGKGGFKTPCGSL